VPLHRKQGRPRGATAGRSEARLRELEATVIRVARWRAAERECARRWGCTERAARAVSAKLRKRWRAQTATQPTKET
jgi:hypothetical protein